MFQTGYKYHFITALVFVLAGAALLLKPSIVKLPEDTATILAVLIMVWGIFRGINGYFLYKKTKRSEDSPN